MAAIKAGNNPAVIQGTVNNIMEFIGSGIVQPLDDYIFNQEIGMNDFEDIYEGYRLENSSYWINATMLYRFLNQQIYSFIIAHFLMNMD